MWEKGDNEKLTQYAEVIRTTYNKVQSLSDDDVRTEKIEKSFKNAHLNKTYLSGIYVVKNTSDLRVNSLLNLIFLFPNRH